MANKQMFRSTRGRLGPAADAINEAGGLAYRRTSQQALAQLAATGCFGATFYATGEEQLDMVLRLSREVEPAFLARTALYARQQAHMKDTPALLLAVLSVRAPELLVQVFARVIDTPKMLRNFVQIMRSGVVGRKSLGSLPKRLVQQWLESRSSEQLFVGSIGNDPSLADVLRMVHPKPSTPERAAMYAYLLGREHNAEVLPESVRHFELYKRSPIVREYGVPKVPFQFLTALPLTAKGWTEIARTASWQTTRMNLNTLARHGVFQDARITSLVAARLRDPEAIAGARVFPYQLMTAAMNIEASVPREIRDALEEAMELALKNVPRVRGKVYVFPDVSGSMRSPLTGVRRGATSSVRCIDVAALVAAAILRQNPDAEIIPFEAEAKPMRLDPRARVMSNAQRLASLPCGGTNCSAPLVLLNQRRALGDLVVYVSDNESWLDSPRYGAFGGSRTATIDAWSEFKTRNPFARMVCIDLQPSATVQAKERPDIVNMGGFSDRVFDLLACVAKGEYTADHWVRTIESMKLGV